MIRSVPTRGAAASRADERPVSNSGRPPDAIHPAREGGRFSSRVLYGPGRWRLLTLLAAALLLAGCAIEPQPIQFGSESCAQCWMVISEPQFAAQALNRRGRAYSFDSIECLAAFVLRGEQVPPENLHSTWVAPLTEPETWIRAEDAHYLRSETLRSPMGEGLSAYPSLEEARAHQTEFGGQVMTWDELLATLQQEWYDAPHAHRH